MLRIEVDGAVRELPLERAVVAGYTGRDRAAVERHVAELAELGVPRPAAIPAYYPMPAELLLQTDAVTAAHPETSGEAEVALLVDGGEWLVTLASDHTDRRAEATDVALSKRLCPKPLAGRAWRYRDVAERWDGLELRSWIEEDGAWCLYQEGGVAELLPLPELVAGAPAALRSGRFGLLCGTVPVRGAIRPGERFRAELHDPRGERTIRLEYRVRPLDVEPSG